MKIVFFGTPVFAAECLHFLLDHRVEICAIVTQPDKPKGRSLQLTPSAVKLVAEQKGGQIPIFQPEKASNSQFLESLASLKADLFVVVAYGQILSQKLLDIPSLGCINVHASLLPKYRGAAPIQRCLMDGVEETGIAIQKMVRQLDAGDVIAVAKTKVLPDMTFAELQQKLLELAKPLLLDVIARYQEGIPSAVPQDHSQASYASKIELEEGEIRWELPAQKIHNLIRAFSPRPGAWCWILSGSEKKRLKILRSKQVLHQGFPRQFFPQEAIVVCAEGALQLIEVQPEGKKAMSALDWLRGQKEISF